VAGDVGEEDEEDIAMNSWQLEEAQRRFNKVVELAIERGPQLITRRGEKVAVVISYEEYVRTASTKKPQSKLSEFFRTSPLANFDIDLNRDKGLPREAGK
jgi:antitoxin Phd